MSHEVNKNNLWKITKFAESVSFEEIEMLPEVMERVSSLVEVAFASGYAAGAADFAVDSGCITQDELDIISNEEREKAGFAPGFELDG